MTAMDSQERILVLGIGNPLMMDEGVGVRAVEALIEGYEFPSNVTLLDAGTMGMSILGLFGECDYMLVLDAVKGTGEPAGTVVRLSAEDLADNQVMHSLHDLRFIDVLQAAELMGSRPEAECIGVQIADMSEIRIGLTPDVESAVPEAVRAALTVLEERGITASVRETLADRDGDLAALRAPEPGPGRPERP